MSSDASASGSSNQSLIRMILMGWAVVAVLQTLIYQFLFVSVMGGIPFLTLLQYNASTVMGEAAFEGGLGTAVLGFVNHLIVSLIIASVFIGIVDRVAIFRRYAIVLSLVYGFLLGFIMSILLKFTAAPPLPDPSTLELVVWFMDHMLVVALPLGIIVWRNAKQRM